MRLTDDALSPDIDLVLRLGDLLDGLSDGFVLAQPDGRVVRVSRVARELLGLDGEEVPEGLADLGAVCRWHDDSGPVGTSPPLRALAGESFRDLRFRLLAPARGLDRYANVSAAPVAASDGTPALLVLSLRDVTREVRDAARQRRRERQLRRLLDALPVHAVLLTPRGMLVEINATALARSGWAREEALGSSFVEATLWSHEPALRDAIAGAVADAASGSRVRLDTRARLRDGEEVEIELTVSPLLSEEGEVRYLVATLLEIGERKRVEVELRRAAEQKALMLKEMNHRIKNSLQLITVMLHMQLSQMKDPLARSALEGTVARMQTVATLHGRLYRQDGVREVAMRPFLEQMVADTRKGLLAESQGSVDCSIAEVWLATDQAIPLGLVASELLTNAIKHGAVEGIRLALRPCEGSLLELEVVDRGPGFSDAPGPEGLGGRLIRALVQQIGGELARRDMAPGGCVTIRFAPRQAEPGDGLPGDA